MAAPSGIKWGDIVGSYGRIGIYVNATTSATTVSGTIEIWFWSKYSVTDSGNNLYYDNRSSSGSATTKVASGIGINHTVATGEGWSTSNQTKLKSYSFSYNRGTSTSTRYLYAKFADIDKVGGTMYANATISIPKLASYTISYNANGGSSAPGSQTKWHGKDLALSSTKPTRTGYSFQKWNTKSDGTGTNYNPGGAYSANANVTLHAIWKANEYTILYNANGGSGAPAKQIKTYGTTLKLSATKPTRENYNFKGWATSASATTATYQAGGNYTANAGATLYAVWELAYVKPRIKDVYVSRVYLDEVDGVVKSDSATNAQISLSWECDKDVTSILVEWKKVGESTWKSTRLVHSFQKIGYARIHLWGEADTFDAAQDDDPDGIFISSDAFSSDSTYSVRISITDTDTSYVVQSLAADKCLMEGLPRHAGISFGKPAELEGVADFGFLIMPREGFRYLTLDPGTDLNEKRTPNIYVGENVSTYSYANCPITSGTFTLEVIPGGSNGQVKQILTRCDKYGRNVFERTYYTNSWSDWYGEWKMADLTKSGNFTNYYANGSEAPKYRRVGELVEIRGTVKPTADIAYSTDYTTIFTLPRGYCPGTCVFTLCQGSGHCVWLMRVDTDGNVGLTRYRNGDVSTTATTTVWLPFHCTFLVD